MPSGRSSATRPKITGSSAKVRAGQNGASSGPGRLGASGKANSISAYPRTDPIKALGGLLKLLTSLPGRVGGSAFKLTHSEHELALHLVAVLDPYVYHGARALIPAAHVAGASSTSHPTDVSIVHLPTEVLDSILGHIETKTDLLNVGLVCRRLYDVIFPRHFDYRVIRCKVSSLSVWNHLIKHRSLARNVRRLEILDERSNTSSSFSANHNKMLIPRAVLTRDSEHESSSDELFMHAKHERYMAMALGKLTGLEEFRWACYHSPISFERVWPTLYSMISRGKMELRRLQVCDNMLFGPKASITTTEESSHSSSESDRDVRPSSPQGSASQSGNPGPYLTPFTTHVVIRSTGHVYGAPKQPELPRITELLSSCVNLENLELAYLHPSPRPFAGQTPAQFQPSPIRSRPIADDLLSDGRWAHLTSLKLSNLRCLSHDAPSSFLSLHPQLEVLHFDVTVASAGSIPLVLDPGALPRLKEIKATKEVIQAILSCPVDSPRPLEVVKGFKLSGTRSSSDLTFLSTLRASGAQVKKVELIGWHDTEDVRRLVAAIPNATHLNVGRRLGMATAPTSSRASLAAGDKGIAPVTNMAEWAEILSTLPELTNFHGVRFFYEVVASPVGAAISISDPSHSHNSTPVGGDVPLVHITPTLPSMTDRSRMRKNDEIAGVFAWKCRKLRILDHWEEGGSKAIVLLRSNMDSGSAKDVRWEVRRVKAA